MLRKIIYFLLFLLAAYFVLCFVGPKHIDININKKIDASASAIFSQFGDFRNFKNWGVWFQQDTAIDLKYSNPSSGKGAYYTWESKKSGNGKMVIMEQEINKSLQYDLIFLGGKEEMHSRVDVLLTPDGKSTNVNWKMKSEKEIPLIFRAFMLIINMNGSIQKDFEKGLDNLNEYLKKNPNSILANGFYINSENFSAQNFLGKRETVKFINIGSFFSTHLPALAQTAAANMIGVPCGLFWKYDMKNQITDMAAAVPVNNNVQGNDIYSIISIPDSKSYTLDYYGDYTKTEKAYMVLDSIIKMNGLSEPTTVLEQYITDPMVEKDTTNWLTKIHFLFNK